MKNVQVDILTHERTKAGLADSRQEQWYVEIDRVLSRRGWMLVTNREQFAQAVCAELEARFGGARNLLTATAIERATIHQYCFILYDACAGANRSIQRGAFEELWNHLYRVGIFKTHDKERAKDSAQQALINIWRHLDQCRDKGSFLNWCNLIVLNIIRGQFRKEMKHTATGAGEKWVREEIPLAEVADLGEVLEQGEPGDSDSTGETRAFRIAVRGELHTQLVAAIRACLKSEAQQTVIIESFLNDRGFKEVAEELHTTPGNAQVMKSRALGKLRHCEVFIRLYEEWLDVSPASNS
jgi:RNA polymerase sigma factor (sigma-70 family)